MQMDVIQARLPAGLIREINLLVKKGLYANRSDVIRDAVRKMMLERQIGSIPNTGNSVKEAREIRRKLSKEHFDLDEINSYGRK
jgi:Arc/MetJ-type ribon-helix-helix transcriptional regulator